MPIRWRKQIEGVIVKMQTFPVVLFRTIVLALAIGLCGQQNAQAATLRDAATINSTNASQVPFDQVYRITPHNTYNPNDWHSLTEALDQGVRTIELDVYNSVNRAVHRKEECDDFGGQWLNDPGQGGGAFVCRYDPYWPLAKAVSEALAEAVKGQPIPSNPLLRRIGLQVKHDPTDEDPNLGYFLGWVGRLINGDKYYGNNCSGGDVTTVGNMKTELARCLETIRVCLSL
jgi:hypothetical protein